MASLINYANVIDINLDDFKHTGTDFVPSEPGYETIDAAPFLKTLSKHFNKAVEEDASMQDFSAVYQGAQVNFVALPRGYNYVQHMRPNKSREDKRVYGHFLTDRSYYKSAPEFLEHVKSIMRLDLVDWLELRDQHVQTPDVLSCICVHCAKPKATDAWIKRKVDREAASGPLRPCHAPAAPDSVN